MNWQPKTLGKCALVELSGTVEGPDYQQFLQLEHWLDDRLLRRVILDLSRVERFDAHAFEGLVHLSNVLQIRRGDACLVAPQPALLEMMEESGLQGVIETRQTVAQARDFLESTLWF